MQVQALLRRNRKYGAARSAEAWKGRGEEHRRIEEGAGGRTTYVTKKGLRPRYKLL